MNTQPQPHLFTSEQRGGTTCTLTIRDLYRIIRERLEYEPNFTGDPDVLCQRFCVEVEKQMGIYPNVEN